MARSKTSDHFTDAVDRLRPSIAPRLRDQQFDPAVGYLDLSEDRRERLTASTVAMRLPLVSAVYERWWRPGLVRVAKGFSGPSMEGEYSDAQRLLHMEAGDHVLDVACCFAALHMFPDPEKTLDEFARVLKPGGHVALLTTTVSGHPAPALAAHAFGRISSMRMFRVEELCKLLEARGFTVEDQQSAGVTQLVGAVLKQR